MDYRTFCFAAFAVSVVAAAPCFAELELVSPVGGAVVSLVPDAQKKAMAPATLEERINFFAEDRANGKVIRHDKLWRKANPLVLKWRMPGREKRGWKVEIGTKPDLSDARVWYFKASRHDAATGRDITTGEGGAETTSYTVPLANLELGRDYYWRVTGRGRCDAFNCSPICGCKHSKKVEVSETAKFRTEDFAPRWIALNGHVGNFRDLGGWHTTDGRRVRQGLIYRGQGLNSNSETGEHHGRNRLTVEDLKYMIGTLGIRTDLDLRSKGETADLAESPLGPGVKFVLRSSDCYNGIFTDKGKATMAENFRLLCQRETYPVYIHCIGGADRTGSLAYVLLGVLGVSRHDMEVDWESTFYPNIPDADTRQNWCKEAYFTKGFSKYGNDGDSWNRRVELYLLDCGVTAAEIDAFRAIMLE